MKQIRSDKDAKAKPGGHDNDVSLANKGEMIHPL